MKAVLSRQEFIQFDRGCLTLPSEALEDCYHQGDCSEDVDYWVNRINWGEQELNDEMIMQELKEYGCWDEQELADDHENKCRILWIAAGNYAEEKQNGF